MKLRVKIKTGSGRVQFKTLYFLLLRGKKISFVNFLFSFMKNNFFCRPKVPSCGCVCIQNLIWKQLKHGPMHLGQIHSENVKTESHIFHILLKHYKYFGLRHPVTVNNLVLDPQAVLHLDNWLCIFTGSIVVAAWKRMATSRVLGPAISAT